MKLTPTHHKNSQIHGLPLKDIAIKHTVSLDCPCKPKMKMENGHILVMHCKSKGTPNEWTMKLKNFGKKLLSK